MWILTGGRTLYRVWSNRLLKGDNKPQTTYSERESNFHAHIVLAEINVAALP